ncbi:hypothetical protein [Atopobium sp. oral taxon 199]|uniref:hypothetical protein n=1 Tax=Atopobium sp. oral taxon 199 TaxID=712156 RepID=UPI0012ECA98D|nr:hypothetical protein [Atopobium sp. oral taxon 199]
MSCDINIAQLMAFLGDLSQLMPFLGDFVSQLWHFFGNLEAHAGRSTTTCGLLTPEPQRTQTAACKTAAHASGAEAEKVTALVAAVVAMTEALTVAMAASLVLLAKTPRRSS